MKKEMEIKLYKLEVIPGKENIAEEWLEFLKQNKEAGEALLKKKKLILKPISKAWKTETCIFIYFSRQKM
ncbi:hypothetical protein HMPREF9466_02112 [Fusobacterium necrophorum subsp. funduliforme 1_1_36S]|nr:hypothetical protein HMPREF9466_02112 [Fusobacterium necrophorum subsp. funduliforme 1_1_36S]